MKTVIELQAIKKAIKEIAKAKGFTITNKTLVENHILYARKELTGKTGNQRVLETSDARIDQVRNINNGALNTGELFVCTGVAFSVAVGSKKIDNEKEYASLKYLRSLNPDVQVFANNEFTLKVSDSQKLKMVIRHAMSETPVDNSFYNDYAEVMPFVIEGNQGIMPEVNCLTPIGAPDKPYIFEMSLMGYKLTNN